MLGLNEQSKKDEKAQQASKNLLYNAILEGDFARIQTLIEGNKSLLTEPLDSEGHTALHLAALYGRIKILDFFVEHGAPKDITTRDGFSVAGCVHYALYKKWREETFVLSSKERITEANKQVVLFFVLKDRGFLLNENDKKRGQTLCGVNKHEIMKFVLLLVLLVSMVVTPIGIGLMVSLPLLVWLMISVVPTVGFFAIGLLLKNALNEKNTFLF
jgi:hypothetical protein